MSAGKVEVAELNLERGEDFLRIHGGIDLEHADEISGELDLSVQKLPDYFPKPVIAGGITGRFSITGRKASCDSLAVTDGAATLSMRASVDFTDWNKPTATLTPLVSVADLTPPAGNTCINSVRFQTTATAPSSIAVVSTIDLRADFREGTQNLKLTSAAGERDYRLFCLDEPTAALTLAIGPVR